MQRDTYNGLANNICNSGLANTPRTKNWVHNASISCKLSSMLNVAVSISTTMPNIERCLHGGNSLDGLMGNPTNWITLFKALSAACAGLFVDFYDSFKLCTYISSI